MTYLSVCSGIEAATVAWHPLGWTPWAFAEIDRFPSAVLAHHYPSVPNLGDMTRFREWPDAVIDLLVGGTPCQSFSVAGLRAGLADPRGSLLLVYLALADRYRPRWVVWENVPGVLSADDGRAFGSLLGGLAALGYGFAYRVLDAQYFGLAQRRARVFVVGHLGDWRRAAAVLFERESLSGHPAPRREAGQTAPTVPSRRTAGGGLGTDFDCDSGTGRGTPLVSVANTLAGYGGGNQVEQTYVPIDMRQDSRGATMTNNRAKGSSGGAPGTGIGKAGDPSPTIASSHVPAVAFQARASASNTMNPDTVAPTLDKGKAEGVSVLSAMQVRRLTPRECERLQGFPDDYTLIPYRGKLAADGPRYKALGNSMAVSVMYWIGSRIALVDAIPAEDVA